MADPIGCRTYPDRRQVSLISGGGLIAVGLPLREDLLVQEYFAEGVPHYALANTSDGTLEVNAAGVTARRERSFLAPGSSSRSPSLAGTCRRCSSAPGTP